MSRGRRLFRAGGALACSVLALLLWSKLKLVSGIPRTAFADPERNPAPQPPAPGGDAPADRLAGPAPHRHEAPREPGR